MPVHATKEDGFIRVEDLGTGTPDGSKFLRDDQVWAIPSSGAGVYQPLADVLTTTTAAFTTAQENKLAGVAAGATVNSADATLLARANHTGTQAVGTITGLGTAALASAVDFAAAGHAHAGAYQPLATVLTNTTAAFTTDQETKLSGVATGATANSPDASLLARANHTGTQLAATVSDFSSAADARVAVHAALTSAHGISAFGQTLVDDADAAAARSTLGLGTAATSAAGDFATAGHTHGGIALAAVTVTVPYNVGEYLATVTDAAVSGTSKIGLYPGMYEQTDQNSQADITAHVESVTAGSFALLITALRNELIGGEFKFVYALG